MINPDEANELRYTAEAYLDSRRDTLKKNNLDLPQLVHELQVDEIELEMQNNELLQTRTSLESALTSYTELYDFAPVGYLTLSPDGLISKINLTGATLLGMTQESATKALYFFHRAGPPRSLGPVLIKPE